MSERATARRDNPSDNQSGNVLKAIADELTAHGFDVRAPTTWEQSSLIHLTNVRGALCEVTLTADATVAWDYRPFHGARTTPDQIAHIAMTIMGAAHPLDQARPTVPCPGLTFKGIVGRALAERGLSVNLKVIHVDQADYEVYAIIEAINPAQPTRGYVQVGDDSSIRWHVLTTRNGPAPRDIAQTITAALSGCNT